MRVSSAEQPACRKRRVLRKLGTKRNPLLPPLERLHTAAALVLVICVSTAPIRTRHADTRRLQPFDDSCLTFGAVKV